MFFPLDEGAGLSDTTAGAPASTSRAAHDHDQALDLMSPAPSQPLDPLFLDPAFTDNAHLRHGFDPALQGPDTGIAPPPLGFDNAGPFGFEPGPSDPTAVDWAAAETMDDSQLQQDGGASNAAIIDDFFLKNGACRPPVPCLQCKRQRLQCLILQTTAANPNPITSCSSCVALFRDCSLAEREKRQASSFETSRPVIGHLHGVNEENNLGTFDEEPALLPDGNPAVPIVATKRISTRSGKKTRALSNWFATHLDHPYPSEDEKSELAKQCGMSKTQVINWFANARRRHRLSAQSLFNSTRVFRQGSPMPESLLSNLSPVERWRSSTPDDDPVSGSTGENVLSGSPLEHSDYFGSYGSGRDGSVSSASGESGIYPFGVHDNSSNHSANSATSQQSNELSMFSFSNRSAEGVSAGPSNTPPSATRTRSKEHTFQCTFCLQSFRKRYDWVRHERSIHLPGLDSWICTVPLPPDQSFLVWRVDQANPECIFCGHSSPTHEHIQSHEFQTCSERPVSERTFTRKDHLWQHLHKFHRCKKWEGWKPNLNLLQHRQDKLQSQCGFCNVMMNSWEERAQHLASHFRRGATMAEWSGGPGVRLSSEDAGTLKIKGHGQGSGSGPGQGQDGVF